jgi:hypothetical protein
MGETAKNIQLSTEEVRYLVRAMFLPTSVAQSINAALDLSSKVLSISPEMAKELGDALTVRLAQVGFADSYDLTSEGQLLEDLIARL